METHEAFKPSGLIGQGIGILGTLMILIGVVTYMIRKRWSRVQHWGSLKNWLRFHIFLCTLGPYLVLLHTTFKFGNIASIAFWSMAIVVISGIFGRYVYAHIPKAPNGRFLDENEIRQTQIRLLQKLAAVTQLNQQQLASLIPASVAAPPRLGNALKSTLGFRYRMRQYHNDMSASLRSKGLPASSIQLAMPLLVDEARLSLQRQTAAAFVKAFSYWHVLHIPLALVMLVTLIVHVGVAIAFGYTWIF